MLEPTWPPQKFREALSGAQGLSKWIRNVETNIHWEPLGDFWTPITKNSTEFASSYVVSPYAALILYSRQEMAKLPRYLQVLELILGPLSVLVKGMRLNEAVCVNNWLLSTNLYPASLVEPFALQAMKTQSAAPQSFLIFRSLNAKTNSALMARLHKLGFSFIPSRQVYFFDFTISDSSVFRNFERDQKLLAKTAFKISAGDEFNDEDFARAEQLYDLLYLEKYSIYNPAFSAQYLRLCQETGVMKFFGLRDEHARLQGVVGYFIVEGVMTVPIVGYETSRPQQEGLYRLLMAMALKYAKQEKLILNLSSGASQFKIFRGGQPVIEYSAVYFKHLSWPRRICFRLIQGLLYSVALPLLKLFKL